MHPTWMKKWKRNFQHLVRFWDPKAKTNLKGQDQSSSFDRAVQLDPEEQRKRISEILRAMRDWHVARNRFEVAANPDQIDYAIYALEAAEKHYEMLLREAKKNGLSALDVRNGRWMEVPK